MVHKLFQDAFHILAKIEKAGYEAYIVGGCVRDYLLKQTIHDIDIATSASKEVLEKIFSRVIPVHDEHETVIVIYKGTAYEVTSFRTPTCNSSEVTLTVDLQHRDFTINALAMDRNGKIIDLFNGQEDLQRKQIKAVGDAHARFCEDPLRMLRAIRFASQFDFTIAKETLQAIIADKERLRNVAIERIVNELRKLFLGNALHRGITYLIETELAWQIPGLQERPHLLEKLPTNLTRFVTFSEVIALFHYIDQTTSIQTWVKTWKLSNHEKKEAIILVERLKEFAVEQLSNWLIYQLPETLDAAFVHLVNMIDPNGVTFEEVKERRAQLPLHSRSELAISGKDIIACFPERKPGKWIEQLLSTIEKKVVLHELVNDHQQIKEWIICHRQEIN